MKTLYLLRHAKSSWDEMGLADFERPLNDRGRKTAPLMGELMRERGLVPDFIVSSPAERAKQTANLVAGAAEIESKIRVDERIYEASPQRLLEAVTRIEDLYKSAMIIGHNPGIEGFIRYLTGDIESMPTAALAVIKLDTKSWSDISAGMGKLESIIRPKDEFSNSSATAI